MGSVGGVSDRSNPDDPTIGKLVADASRDISSLVTKEIELAKTELKVSLTAGGMGAAFFAGAVFILLLGVIMLSVSFAYFINLTGIGLHWSFLIVFVLYLLLAALLGFLGYRKVKQVKAPEQTLAAMKSNKQVLKRG